MKKREYLGHTVNFKTRKHFKDKKSHYIDESEWTIFENTHEAIIDQETFDNVQRIRAEVVLTLVSDMLRAIADYSKNNRAEFVRTVQQTQAAQQASDISKKKKRLAAAQKRAGELEKLICKIYEDNVIGKLPDAPYVALDAQYVKKQDELETKIAQLEKAIGTYEQTRKYYL